MEARKGRKKMDKKVLEIMKLDLQCSRCGSRVRNACANCQVSFNHWNNCYEEAKRILESRLKPHTEHKPTNKSAKAIDNFLDYLDSK